MIGSVTKTFTALTVMSLRDEGLLSLDDTLETYLPGTRHARVPLRQMLAHASGLQREPVGNIWETLVAPEREEFLAGVEEAEQVLPAHHAFHYSNLAYGLLGQVVERVTGQDWEQVVRERVLDPLGMTRTGLTPADDRAVGYQVDPYAGTASEEPLFSLGATAPLGGLWSTVADMARYAAYVARPDDRVVRPETVEEMCRPIIMTDVDGWSGAYGLGFGMGRRGDRVYVGHGGAMPGFLTGLRVRRKEGVGAIVFANATSGRAHARRSPPTSSRPSLDAEPSLAAPWVPETEQPGPHRAARPVVVGGLADHVLRPRTASCGRGSPTTSRSPRRGMPPRAARPLPAVRGPRARRAPRGRARRRRVGRQALLRDVCRDAGAARVRRPAAPDGPADRGGPGRRCGSGGVLAAGDLRLRHAGAAHLEGAHDGVPRVALLRRRRTCSSILRRVRRHMSRASPMATRIRP